MSPQFVSSNFYAKFTLPPLEKTIYPITKILKFTFAIFCRLVISKFFLILTGPLNSTQNVANVTSNAIKIVQLEPPYSMMFPKSLKRLHFGNNLEYCHYLYGQNMH